MDSYGKVADPFDCDQLVKPEETQTCILRACGYWRTGTWGKVCSHTMKLHTHTLFVELYVVLQSYLRKLLYCVV